MREAWESIGDMVNSSKTKSTLIGLIAEDKSDVDVIKVIFEKYTESNKFSVRHFVGNGCGKLRNKCGSWSKTLVDLGCEYIVILHDLDRENETKLKKILEEKVPKKDFPNSLIVIPTEELEAWLLADMEAIKKVFSFKTTPKEIKDSESVRSPKEEIGKIVWMHSKKRYLNSNHNLRIAQLAKLENFRKCRSYSPLDKFINEAIFPEIK